MSMEDYCRNRENYSHVQRSVLEVFDSLPSVIYPEVHNLSCLAYIS